MRYHKSIVLPHSPLLSGMIKKKTLFINDVTIILDDVDKNILKYLMDCIYRGRCQPVSLEMHKEMNHLKTLLDLNIYLDYDINYTSTAISNDPLNVGGGVVPELVDQVLDPGATPDIKIKLEDYKCDICFASFNLKIKLKKHQRKHEQLSLIHI